MKHVQMCLYTSEQLLFVYVLANNYHLSIYWQTIINVDILVNNYQC